MSKTKTRKMILSTILLSALSLTVVSPAFADAASDLKAADAAVQTANDEYDAAITKQSEIVTQIETINQDIADKQVLVNDSIRDRYINGSDLQGMLKAVITGETINDIINAFEGYTKISEWRTQQLNDLNDSRQQLEKAKQEQDATVEQANNAKQEAIEAQGAAREAVEELKKKQAAASVQSIIGNGSTERAATSSTWSDAESAKAFIVGKESGGRYNAQNGKYYGAYQLSLSYLNGDLSPENQDRVAENYVNNRYGGWVGAAQFWQAHGWY